MSIPVLCRYRRQLHPFILFCLFLLCLKQTSGQYISTVAGNGVNGYTGDGGLAVNAGVPYPEGICFDAAGNLYIACTNRVRKVDAQSGLITLFAGNGQVTYSGDGGPATGASFFDVLRICSDKSGAIYVSDFKANCIRKISASGIVTTIAGTGTPGFSGDGGPAVSATLNAPWSLATDAAGNLYFFDSENFRIRKIDAATGIITTIAGTGVSAYSGDGGPAYGAGIGAVTGLFIRKNGDIYFSEAHRSLSSHVRKIDAATGVITTVAGTGTLQYSGDGGPALSAGIAGASGIALDAADNIYISEYDDGRIRKIDAVTGIINTFAGTGFNGFNGESGPATNIRLNYPKGLAFDAAGNLYIADNNNLRVRKVGSTPLCTSPSVVISTAFAYYCFYASNHFTASVTGAGPVMTYQWKRNGSTIASNEESAFISDLPGDVITCEITTTNSCGNAVTIVSNPITIQSNPGYNLPPEVTIAATADTICTGMQVHFTATNVSQSAVKQYQWLVNGAPVGTDSPTFSTSTLKDGDRVECIMYVFQCSNTGPGSTKDYSDPIIMKVDPVLNPGISISTPSASVCKGNAVVFTATAAQAGAHPLYQWKLNGQPVGINSPTFTTTTLKNGDAVSCELTVDPAVACATKNIVATSPLVMQVLDVWKPSVQVAASQTGICDGTPVSFTATGSNAGSNPVYQWQVNGNNTSGNNTQYIAAHLSDGDQVRCILAPAAGSSCTMADTSAAIPIRVFPTPDVQFNPSSVLIEPGQSLQLNPVVQGAISTLQWTPANLLVNPTSLTPTTVPLTATTAYNLWVQTADGCIDTASMVITVYSTLYMPNSFTPNGDGKNDVFRIPAAGGFRLTEFCVFDRWGNRVFSTTDPRRGWDGKTNGVPLASDTYVFTVTGKDNKGPVFIKGTVQLIR